MHKTLFQNIQETIISTIEGAKDEVVTAVAWFTDREIYRALWDATEREVKVSLIFQDDEINWQSGLDYEALANKGASVYAYSQGAGILHHKFCIVDKGFVMIGTYNWTYMAANYNQESVIVFEGDDAPVGDFLGEFEKLRSSSNVKALGSSSPTLLGLGSILAPGKVLKETKTPLPAHLVPEMVFVEGGTFVNGDCDFANVDQPDEVKLNSFWIGRYPVTFEQYDAFCEAKNIKKLGDKGWGRGNNPVIDVSWYDAIEYCNWLSRHNNLQEVYRIDKTRKDPDNHSNKDRLKWLVTADWNANGFRLPTEAEWEYAARGRQEWWDYGYAGSRKLDEVGWNHYNSNYQTHPVGLKEPNELGLYDMSGNVSEFCWDWWNREYELHRFNLVNIIVNPKGGKSGSCRAARGGSYEQELFFDSDGGIISGTPVRPYEVGYYRDYLQVLQSFGVSPIFKSDSIGFRVAGCGY